jgi:hypothetical protein
MSIRITGSRLATAAVLAGIMGLGGSALSHPALAQPKSGGETKAGCSYAGQSYSDGSTRQQLHNNSNGTSYYENYRCDDGSWTYTGTSRGSSSQGPVDPPPKRAGRVS